MSGPSRPDWMQDSNWGGGGGGARLLDLGLVEIPDLIDGGVELYTPAVGDFVALTVGSGDYEAWDSFLIGATFLADYSAGLYFYPFLAPGSGVASAVSATKNAPGWVVRLDDPIVFAMLAVTADKLVLSRPPAWAAGHAYAERFLILGPDDHVWSSSTGGGTSDSSTPDFEGNEAGTVVDNDITWTDEGAIPTTGAIHFYAFVQTPEAP